MIDADTSVFPNNVVDLTSTRAALLDAELTGNVWRRPLRTSDANTCIGCYASIWNADENSIEFTGAPSPGPIEPTLQRYTLQIQAMIKDTEEERGLYKHANLSKMVRSMLYHDDPLRVALASLSATTGGRTESARRWGLGTTRYLSNEIKGSWIYLSTLDFWLETETQ